MQLARVRKEKMTILKSQETIKRIGHGENEIPPKEGRWMYCGGSEYKKLRGRAMRRRDKRISDTLHQVHKPYHSRPVENTVSDAGTILFDLS